ncbi:hypothetical protein M9H77_19812 [Catharanthus roseus]|uniref:Uncharacterized protein n=1 Tax=Catharanthus roseus TaxID=4058 RepID=A0ACC0BBD3_CATRO|nr:hypothetical protein M9H77_19812 [Catharanthus roseus]
MAKTKLKNRKFTKNLTPKLNQNGQKKKKLTAPKEIEIPIDSSPSTSSSSDSEFEADPEKIRELLEPYSKDQLIELITDFAVSNSSLYVKIQEKADKDISHRKLFIHGLSWDTTNESLMSEFQKYGEIESCHVVPDRNTGKAKGYAFLTYISRESALNALKQPRKNIKNRLVNCQLASLGPTGTVQGGQQQEQDGKVNGRKIYVTNVSSDVDAEKLRSFFASFGELEAGPTGFDPNTGKFRGYALFLYKTVEGAKKALEEPYKLFEGRQLHCEKATEGKKIGGGAAAITVSVQSVPPVMAAVPTQNMPLLGQNSNLGINTGLLSALYGGLLVNPNAAAGLLNLNSYGTLGQAAGVGVGMGMGVGDYSGGITNYSFSNLSSSLGSGISLVSGNGGAGSNGLMPYGLLHTYPNMSNDLPSSSSAQAPRTVGQASFL